MGKLRGQRISVGVADGSLCESLSRALRREEAEVLTYADAAALLAGVAPSAPNVCILDVDLEPSSIQAIVAGIGEKAPKTPIILVSAHLLPPEAVALAALPVLPLPFRRRQLLALLDQVLKSRAA